MKAKVLIVPKLIILMLSVIMIIACLNIESKPVSKEKFQMLYSNKWSYGDYWEYKGVKNGKHWLIHYKLPQVQTLPVAVESVWVSVEDLPEDFPQTKQQPLNKGDLEELLK